MTLSPIRTGDIVLCNRGGREFHALVIGKIDSLLDVRPIDSRISYRSAKAREVIGHWRKSARRS